MVFCEILFDGPKRNQERKHANRCGIPRAAEIMPSVRTLPSSQSFTVGGYEETEDPLAPCQTHRPPTTRSISSRSRSRLAPSSCAVSPTNCGGGSTRPAVAVFISKSSQVWREQVMIDFERKCAGWQFARDSNQLGEKAGNDDASTLHHSLEAGLGDCLG